MKELMTTEETRDVILKLAKRLTALCDAEAEINKKMAFIRNQKVEIINKMHVITTGHVAEESISISELGFDERTTHCLMRRGGPEISTLTELLELSQSDLMNTRGIGCVKYQEIVRRMHELGYKDFPRS